MILNTEEQALVKRSQAIAALKAAVKRGVSYAKAGRAIRQLQDKLRGHDKPITTKPTGNRQAAEELKNG